MEKSAIILAGGFSSRVGQDKGLAQLRNKPLIKYVLDSIEDIVEEKIVVVSSETQVEHYTKAIDSEIKVLTDVSNTRSPLAGAVTGFEEAGGKYSLLLACDVPFVSKEIISLLFELCVNKAAAIPRWPNGYVEPLQAVYCTQPTSEAARNALSETKFDMCSMLEKLRGIRYVSTLVLQQLDPELRTFFNVNTLLDLKKAEQMLETSKKRQRY